MKKIGLLLILAFTTFFSSCEKDLYEEAVYEQPKLNGKFSTVSIEDAPFLKPSIESFKSKHFNHSNGIAYRVIDSLDLDLNKIAVYEQENGVKSYSIAVKESVFENDDYYFENLHILESGDKYEYFIIKYNPLDDSKKMDYSTYTGKMEVYNEDRKFVGTIVFENGAFKLIDTTPPTGEEPIGGGGGSDPTDPDCPCNSNSPSLLSQFFSWIGDLFSNINITPGSPDNTGYVLIATSPNMGSTNNNTTPTQTTSGNNIAVTPNEPEWTYPAMSQLVMANKIMSRLVYYNPGTLSWLKNPINHNVVDQLYFYMAEGGNNGEINTFASNAIVSLMNGGNIEIGNQVIIDQTFTDSKSDCVHNKLKVNQNNIYSKMLTHFNSNTTKTLTFKIGATVNGDWGITKGNINSSNNYIITTSYYVENGSNLMKIVTLSHELMHAYMFSVLETNGLITFVNGDPIANITCLNNINYNNINLNGMSIGERFVALICAMNQNGTLTPDWTHDLFNSTVFDINTYRQMLETLIFNEYDWNNEDSTFKNEAIAVFGITWREEIAKATSWIGLENTPEYSAYINSYSSNINKMLYLTSIRSKIALANKNCQ